MMVEVRVQCEGVRSQTVKREVSFAPKSQTVSPVLGGAAGLVFPAMLATFGLSTGFRNGGDMSDFAATIAGTILFLVAAPTAWVLSFPFIDVTRFTVIVFGIVTSAPLWWLLGVAIARASVSWLAWVRRYASVSFGWLVFNIVIIAVAAAAIS
jgi:hypothetical protein